MFASVSPTSYAHARNGKILYFVEIEDRYIRIDRCTADIYRTLAKEGLWAVHLGPPLGDGPIFKVSVSRLYSKERPGKLPTLGS